MIEASNLSFSYSNHKPIIQNVSFRVPKGSIYGFLGANGAGKTTTIRLLLNLMKPDRGSIKIDGKNYQEGLINVYKQVGTLIENPTFYGQISAQQNLQIWANYYKVERERIEEVLELVQLTKSKNEKVKKFSQGMKQRLGIATALLHNPDLLVLDEPLSGLDPKGIAEMRELFFSLKAEGKTIFLSSHILAEIEASCDQLCILDKGELKFDGTVYDLNQILSKEIRFEIRGNREEEMLGFLQTLSTILNSKKTAECILIDLKDEKEIALIIKAIIQQKFDLYEVKKKVNRLEDLYLKLTNPS